MSRSSILRFVATAALVLVATAAAREPALAQTPPYGYIGLYADETRSSNSVSYTGPYTEVTMYVFLGPTSRGVSAAEFSIAYPGNVLPADVTTNPLISVSLGNIDSGISVAFADCQNEWVWTHRQRLFLTNDATSRIEIEKNAAADEYQIATCELGNPLEPVFFSSLLCLNAACPPDIVPPLLQGAHYNGISTITVTFSEPVLKKPAQDPASYEIAELNNPSVTIPVGEAVLLSDGASATLYTSQPFVTGGRQYVIHATGVYDPWGNRVPSSSTAVFGTPDTDPPRLASASAEAETLVTAVFNEPVEAGTAANPINYRVYNDSAHVVCYPYRATSAAADRVVLSFKDLNILPSLITLTLKATGVKDLAGNVISSSHNTANFMAPDTRPPYVAAVQVLAQSVLQVRFNEGVIDSMAEITSSYEIYLKSNPLVTVPVIAAEVQPDKRYVKLTLGANLTVEVTYVLRTHDIEDLHGRRMTTASLTEFVWPDVYGPIPVSATPLTRSLIRIQFDERLNKTVAETPTNYRVFETYTPINLIAVSSAALETSADAVRLGLASPMKLDVSYTIRVLKANDLKGNVSSGLTVETAYPDTFPPVPTGVTPISSSSIEIAFDEKLSETPAENASNYILFETANPSNVVGISLATLAEGGSRVRLDLAADLVSGRSYTISMSDIADLKGNIIPPGSSLVFIYGDAIPPSLISAYAAVNTAVLATFSEKLDGVTAENAGNYRVYATANPGVTIPVASAALSGDSSKVLLSLGGTLASGVAYSLSVTGVADRVGNPLPAGSVVPITRPDTTPPHLSAVEAVGLTYVMVTYDEPVSAATAGTAANYLVYPASNPGATMVPSYVDLTAAAKVGLRLAANLAYSTTYKVRISNVTDLSGNAIAPGSEMSFSTEYIPAGSGYIGLYADANRSINSVRQAIYTQFPLYVWCRAGSAGLIATEFSVSYPGNVVALSTTINPLATVSLGDITSDLSIAFGECHSGWLWAVQQTCLLLGSNESTISLRAGPIFANCDLGYPMEMAQIISQIYVNGSPGIATLLQESAASYRGGAVEITWRLSQMDEGARFRVLRKEEGNSAYGAPSEDIEADGLSFTYRDESAEPGTTYRYRVEYIDASGTHALFETDPVAVPALPLALEQNWPNPFNPSTTISYYLPDAVRVRLEIFDVAGHRIACLVDRDEARGNHSAAWNGSGESGRPAAAGIYIYRLTAGRETLSRKMVLVR